VSALDPEEFVRMAADRTRLAVLGRLAVSPARAAEIAAATGLAERDLLRALGRLTAAGLVREDAGVYTLDDAALRAVASAQRTVQSAHPAVLAGLDDDEAAVASRFFRGMTLVEIPAAEGKRRAVLRVLIDEFEPGRYYAESEVRRILRKFHPDDAALRRHLVDEGMLVRESHTRTYWRGGGPPPGGGAVEQPRG
jgi:hypothetical protein